MNSFLPFVDTQINIEQWSGCNSTFQPFSRFYAEEEIRKKISKPYYYPGQKAFKPKSNLAQKNELTRIG